MTISDELYRRAQRIAQARQRDVADVLAESIVLVGEVRDASYPDRFVLLRRVEAEPEPVYHFRSPRFVREK